MSYYDRGNYSKKHSSFKKINKKLAQIIKDRAKKGEIACATAHAIADELGVDSSEIGFTIDMLEIRIVKCQLGLFGYNAPKKKILTPAEEVSEELKGEIKNAIEDGKISCESIWNIAKKLGLKKMQVSSACEALGIKITRCQLGAF